LATIRTSAYTPANFAVGIKRVLIGQSIISARDGSAK
jgi:hypothetical protein